jgi:hypothetical protein
MKKNPARIPYHAVSPEMDPGSLRVRGSCIGAKQFSALGSCEMGVATSTMRSALPSDPSGDPIIHFRFDPSNSPSA